LGEKSQEWKKEKNFLLGKNCYSGTVQKSAEVKRKGEGQLRNTTCGGCRNGKKSVPSSGYPSTSGKMSPPQMERFDGRGGDPLPKKRWVSEGGGGRLSSHLKREKILNAKPEMSPRREETIGGDRK